MKTTIIGIQKFFTFENEDGYEITVKGFSDGVVDVDIPMGISTIGEIMILSNPVDKDDEFIRFIAGCFAKDSNFREEIFRAYGCTSDTEFHGFRLMIDEDSCLITKENSSFFKIKDTIEDFIFKFAQKILDEVNAEVSEFNKKVEALDEVLNSVETIEFKSDRAEELYMATFEKKEEELMGFGVDFVAYVQNFIGKGKSIPEIVQEAVNRFEEIGEDFIERKEEVRLVCEYCRYGDEIYEACLDILAKRFNDELEYF